MKKVAVFFAVSLLSLAVVLFLTNSTPVSAIGLMDGVNAARGNGQPAALFGDAGIITKITNTLLFIAGALAVIMIIFGGLRYVTSAGNSSSVTAAKNTILYAIVGLIIAFLAFAAVNFILGAVSSNISGGGVSPTNL